MSTEQKRNLSLFVSVIFPTIPLLYRTGFVMQVCDVTDLITRKQYPNVKLQQVKLLCLLHVIDGVGITSLNHSSIPWKHNQLKSDLIKINFIASKTSKRDYRYNH